MILSIMIFSISLLSITLLSRTSLSITSLSITSFSTTILTITLSIVIKNVTLSFYDTSQTISQVSFYRVSWRPFFASDTYCSILKYLLWVLLNYNEVNFKRKEMN